LNSISSAEFFGDHGKLWKLWGSVCHESSIFVWTCPRLSLASRRGGRAFNGAGGGLVLLVMAISQPMKLAADAIARAARRNRRQPS
jgi:hypothetical protein